MPNIVSYDVDYISHVLILKLRLNKGMCWTENIQDPEEVTLHEYFNTAYLRSEVDTPVTSPDQQPFYFIFLNF